MTPPGTIPATGSGARMIPARTAGAFVGRPA